MSQTCETCTNMLYEINTYDISLNEFNIVINNCRDYIQGFILAFVDEHGQPIIFDNYETFMKIDSICQNPYDYCYQNTPSHWYNPLTPYYDKNYYTYTQQSINCMPLNTALWTYYINTREALALSFKLKHSHTGPIRLYINTFYTQKEPQCALQPVICNAIYSDLYIGCVCNPWCPGYISWMTNLYENDDHPPTSNDYPYNFT
jgi:hypothetical protein